MLEISDQTKVSQGTKDGKVCVGMLPTVCDGGKQSTKVLTATDVAVVVVPSNTM